MNETNANYFDKIIEWTSLSQIPLEVWNPNLKGWIPN